MSALQKKLGIRRNLVLADLPIEGKPVTPNKPVPFEKIRVLTGGRKRKEGGRRPR